MSTKLPRESFVALAAVAWADGRMTKIEAQGLVQAAKSLGLDADDLAAVERATKEKVTIETFDASKLSAWEGLCRARQNVFIHLHRHPAERFEVKR